MTKLKIVNQTVLTFLAHFKQSAGFRQSPTTNGNFSCMGFDFKSSHCKLLKLQKLSGSSSKLFLNKSNFFSLTNSPKLFGSSISEFLLKSI